MLKSILSAALVTALTSVAASTAFAYPAVNDSASFQGTYQQAGMNAPVTLVNSIKAFNPATAQFLVSTVQTVAGQTDSEDTWTNQDDLISSAQVQALIANCAAQGGVLEPVTTPAGAFNTCKLTQQNSDGSIQIYWFADVPFGLAQYAVSAKTDQGVPYQINLTLSAYVNGQ